MRSGICILSVQMLELENTQKMVNFQGNCCDKTEQNLPWSNIELRHENMHQRRPPQLCPLVYSLYLCEVWVLRYDLMEIRLRQEIINSKCGGDTIPISGCELPISFVCKSLNIYFLKGLYPVIQTSFSDPKLLSFCGTVNWPKTAVIL